MARTGFLLSPVAKDAVSFGLLAAGDPHHDLAGQMVIAMSLSADTASGATACYHSPMRLCLNRLDFPAQDLNRRDGFPELASLSRVLARAIFLRNDYPPQLFYFPNCGSVLRVAPHSTIQLSVEGHPQRLRLGFGIMGPDGAALPQTHGAVFGVSAVGRDGERVLLWSQRLDAQGGDAAQDRQRAMVDLSQCLSSELLLETLPGESEPPSQLQCYWSEIELQ